MAEDLSAPVRGPLETHTAVRRRSEILPGIKQPPVTVEASIAQGKSAGETRVGAPLPEWRGRLALRFDPQGQRTVLAEQIHVGPLLVQRPFYPEDDGTCHVYMLHPPGGIVGGDRLRIEAAVSAGARALLTTPAAGKFYRSAGADAEQVNHLRAAEGSTLEWFPQETILYSAAQAILRTEVHLDGDAKFLGWDIVCLGRPASGERFDRGWCRTSVELWRSGRRLLTERARFEGSGEILSAGWGLAGYPITGSFFATSADPRLPERVRQAVSFPAEQGLFGVTALDGVLIARVLAHQAESARRVLSQVWQVVRQELLGKQAVTPRIWYT
jgi:urease accessory protein